MSDSNLKDRVSFAVMLSGAACLSMIFTAVGPILSAIGTHFGGGVRGDVLAQFMMTLPTIGIVASGPAVGWLMERVGVRVALAYALFAFGAFGSTGLYIDDAWALLGSRLLLGCAGCGVATATTALIGERLFGHRRVRALGYSMATGSAAGFVLVLLAGALASRWGWQAAFGLYLSTWVLGFLTLWSLPSGRSLAKPAAQATSGESLKRLWPIYASIIPFYVVVFMTGVQSSFLLALNKIVDPSVQAWIISAASFGAMVGGLCYGRIEPKFGRRGTLVAALTLMAIGNFIMGSQSLPLIIALGCLVNGFGGSMGSPFFAGIIIDRTSEHVRGRALGLMYTMLFSGEFANPLVVTPLRLGFGLRNAFLIIGASSAIVALYARMKKTDRRGLGDSPLSP